MRPLASLLVLMCVFGEAMCSFSVFCERVFFCVCELLCAYEGTICGVGLKYGNDWIVCSANKSSRPFWLAVLPGLVD